MQNGMKEKQNSTSPMKTGGFECVRLHMKHDIFTIPETTENGFLLRFLKLPFINKLWEYC
jgi:hypothetical protein